MPFITSAGGVRWLRGQSESSATHPTTSPVAGAIRAIRSVVHTLAQISPSTHSSSLSRSIGVSASRTRMVRVTARVVGSRKNNRSEPSLIASRDRPS